jgi:GT2 family glycosyltransferase
VTVPLLAVPCINRPDLLERCLASIDVVPDRVLVIDNSPDGLDFRIPDHLADVTYVDAPPANLGFGGSVNHAIRTHASAPWWCIANADVEFGPGDLARLAAEMTGARWVGITDWRVFGLTFEAVERVGLWDENLHPAYDDDCDYERRCDLGGVSRHFIPGTTSHVGSAAIRSDERYARANARSHASNRAYYVAKWGGQPRGGERYTTPFGQAASLAAWSLDIRRLRDNAWDRDGKP